MNDHEKDVQDKPLDPETVGRLSLRRERVRRLTVRADLRAGVDNRGNGGGCGGCSMTGRNPTLGGG